MCLLEREARLWVGDIHHCDVSRRYKHDLDLRLASSQHAPLTDHLVIMYDESDIFDSADPDQFHLKPHRVVSFDRVEMGGSAYGPITQRRDWIL